jgi:hypothetical protein
VFIIPGTLFYPRSLYPACYFIRAYHIQLARILPALIISGLPAFYPSLLYPACPHFTRVHYTRHSVLPALIISGLLFYPRISYSARYFTRAAFPAAPY